MYAVSVVMPCHNRGLDLPRVLAAYEAQEGDVPFEVIAVDDGSTDMTFDILTTYRSYRFSLRAERLPKNQGPAAARNRGIVLARAPLLLFVGDDILPTPRLVQGHWEAHQDHPEQEIAILGRVVWSPEIPTSALMKHIDGVGAQQFSYFFLKSGQEYDFRHFYTANISMRRKFLHRLDLWFDTSFPYAAFEDVELAFRLARQGLRILYLSHLLGYHYHYHTVWSFANRQYKSGQTAWFLVKKHPAAARKLFRAIHKKSLLFALLRRKRATTREIFQQLEEEILHLASFYEWIPCPFTDILFLSVLDYFYFKGLSHAAYRDSDLALKALGIYVRLGLRPRLGEFFHAVHPQEEISLMKLMEVCS